jgi:hypothetical protein
MIFEMNLIAPEKTPFLSSQFTTVNNIKMVVARACEVEAELALLLAC